MEDVERGSQTHADLPHSETEDDPPVIGNMSDDDITVSSTPVIEKNSAVLPVIEKNSPILRVIEDTSAAAGSEKSTPVTAQTKEYNPFAKSVKKKRKLLPNVEKRVTSLPEMIKRINKDVKRKNIKRCEICSLEDNLKKKLLPCSSCSKTYHECCLPKSYSFLACDEVDDDGISFICPSCIKKDQDSSSDFEFLE